MRHISRMAIVTMRLRVVGIRWGFQDKITDRRLRLLRNKLQKYAVSSLALLILSGCSIPTHPYGNSKTLNEGVTFEFNGHTCGYEYRGTPGFFCDVD